MRLESLSRALVNSSQKSLNFSCSPRNVEIPYMARVQIHEGAELLEDVFGVCRQSASFVRHHSFASGLESHRWTERLLLPRVRKYQLLYVSAYRSPKLSESRRSLRDFFICVDRLVVSTVISRSCISFFISWLSDSCS